MQPVIQCPVEVAPVAASAPAAVQQVFHSELVASEAAPVPTAVAVAAVSSGGAAGAHASLLAPALRVTTDPSVLQRVHTEERALWQHSVAESVAEPVVEPVAEPVAVESAAVEAAFVVAAVPAAAVEAAVVVAVPAVVAAGSF